MRFNSIFFMFCLLVSSLGFGQSQEAFHYGNANNQTFLEIGYQTRVFKGYNQGIQEPQETTAPHASIAHVTFPTDGKQYNETPQDYEQYTQIALKFNYLANHRYNLSAELPYHHNTDYYGSVTVDHAERTEKNILHGIGNLRLGAERIFRIPTKHKTSNLEQLVTVGTILSAPTGKYEVRNVLTDNLHMQPGRPIFGLDTRVQYNLEHLNHWGFSTALGYHKSFNRQNLVTTYSYAYGDEFSVQLSAYKIWGKQLKKIVSLGGDHLQNAQDFLNDYALENTGGQYTMATAGLDLVTKRGILALKGQLPVHQALNGFQLKSKVRVSARLVYYLNPLD